MCRASIMGLALYIIGATLSLAVPGRDGAAYWRN